MAQTMRVYLSETERANHEAHLKKGIHRARVLTRARILLLADRTDGEWRRYSQDRQVAPVQPRYRHGHLQTLHHGWTRDRAER